MTEPIRYYKIEPRELSEESPDGFLLVTAALIWCGLCGAQISGMGGPGNGAICESCGDALKRGELRGIVPRKEG